MVTSDFKPRGVCARMIHVELSDDGSTIEHVAFEGGCNGNLKAIGKLVAGQSVDEIVTLPEAILRAAEDRAAALAEALSD